MTKTNPGAGDSPAHLQSGLTRAIIYLCFGLLLTGGAVAAAQPTANDLQIQTTPRQLLGEQQATRYQEILEPEESISWQVYLPENDSNETPGVLVYVSPMDTGRIDSRWREVMDRQNLIYIAANDSGNKIPTIRRMVLATLAVKALARQYSFDPGRINIAGFSGGGRVASRIASQYPEVFTGALYICGVDFWKKDQTPNVERLLRNRFVFLTGTRDFNRRETRQIQRRYIKAGAQHTKLIVVPGLAHQHPDAAYLNEALQFLLGIESQSP
jgi:acetyl esterase/lipase